MAANKIAFNVRALSRLLSDETLSKKAFLNSIASSLDYGARLIVGFVINPLLVVGLGDYGYGLWQVLGSLVGYISPASGRPTQALKSTVANQQGSTDFVEKRRYVGSALAVWLIFLPLLSLLGGLVIWYAPVWVKAKEEWIWSVRLAAALLVGNMVMISLVDVPRAVLEGENLGYKRIGLSALLVFVGGGLILLALYLETGLAGVAAATLATTLLTGLIYLQVAYSYVSWFGISRPPRQMVRQFFGLSGWFLLWRLIMQLMRGSDMVLLGMLASVELVTDYSLTRYVPETIISFVAIVVFGITPGLGGIIGSGNLPKAARVRGEIMLLTWLVITIVGATVLSWNRSFVQLWVGEEYYVGALPMFMIVVMIGQLVLIRNDANIIDLTLNLRNKVLMGLLAVGLSLAAAWLFVGPLQMGVSGLCLGFVLGRIILSLEYPRQIGRFLGISLASQLASAVRPTAVALLLFVAASGFGMQVTVTTWPGLIVASSSTALLISLFVFYIGLTGTQRHAMLSRIKSTLPF